MTERVRTAVLISGRGSNMVALIEAAHAPDYAATIALVLSDNPDAAGLVHARDAGVLARRSTARLSRAASPSRPRCMPSLIEARIELVCLAGFMRVLSPAFVSQWRGRLLNVHPSLLPDLRGLHTHERALAEGRSEHGCTVHQVSAELDAGPILAQARVPVLPGDDAATLAARVLIEEHRIYPEAVDRVARALRETG